MRVVFDTNIFISAFAIPGGMAERAVLRIIEGRDREALSHVAVILSDMGEWVDPKQTVRVLKDDPDNRILECATFGKADIIVTGDKEMLRLGEFNQVKIVSLRKYLGSF
jgi:predicted nucleic acid-binding protein